MHAALAPASLLPTMAEPIPMPSATACRGDAYPTIAQLLGRFDPTGLAQLDKVSLLNRVDTKYILTTSQLASALDSLTGEYLVLEIEGQRLHRYRTRYFDTAGFDLYRSHHVGRAVRHKVRSRAYVDSGLSFLEVKTKNNKGRTIKHRMGTSELLPHLTPEARQLLAEHVWPDAGSLEAKLENEFLRITLVNRQSAERLTLDLDIRFDHEGRTAVLPGLVIAELKQSRVDRASAFMQRMRAARIHPESVSKYCVGVAMLYPEVPHNAFKAKLRTINKLMRGESDVR